MERVTKEYSVNKRHDNLDKQHYDLFFSIELSCISNYPFKQCKDGKLILRECKDISKNDVVVVFREGLFELVQVVDESNGVGKDAQILGKYSYIIYEV